jgi:hypothetical protein
MENDIVVSERDDFGRPSDSIGVPMPTRSYRIGGEFVQNFKMSDMTIRGPEWLSLNEGFLVGKPPVIGQEKRYEFVVTARNKNGDDSVNLGVIVRPSL